MHRDTFAALALTSLIAIAGQPARLANLPLANLVFALDLTHQNALGHQQRLNAVSLANTGRTVRAICARPPRRAPGSSLFHPARPLQAVGR